MDGDHQEIKNFIKVWTIAIASQCYCYYVAARIPTNRSMMRCISLLPVMFLFIILPLSLHSIHLGCSTAIFLLLATFNLLLFVFDSGPLSPPPTRLLRFISIALLPIHIVTKFPKTHNSTYYSVTKVIPNDSLVWAIKALLLGAAIRGIQDYGKDSHPIVNLILSCVYLCLVMEIGFAISVALPRVLFGFELVPHFNEPYLTTSIQDFWGRRWNLVITNIARLVAYNPIKRILEGTRWGTTLGVIITFAISGFIHEVLFYYVTRELPTGNLISFFVLQGVCLVIEVQLKHAAAAHKVRFHPIVSGPLTLLFLIVTANWLFFPLVSQYGVDRRIYQEAASVVNLVNAALPWRKT